MMPHFSIFLPSKNTVKVVQKTKKKRPKTRFLKFFKILDCLNDYLSNMRRPNYLILGEGVLNFHLKSDSSFYHLFSWFYALVVKKLEMRQLCSLPLKEFHSKN